MKLRWYFPVLRFFSCVCVGSVPLWSHSPVLANYVGMSVCISAEPNVGPCWQLGLCDLWLILVKGSYRLGIFGDGVVLGINV